MECLFFKATAILNEIKSFAPDILKNCKKCLEKSKRDFDFLRLEEEAFRDCDNISIDDLLKICVPHYK